ncbi:hypothetical protein As57867_018619, partial [Aphanomyces stellatus]
MEISAPPPHEVDPTDLATCIRVLDSFHDKMEAFKAPQFKSLRRAVLPLCEDVRSRVFFGKDAATYEQSKQKKQERKRKAMQAAAHDKQFINNTKLRVQRLQALDTLTAANPMLPQIPDGAVEDDGSAAAADVAPDDIKPSATLHGFRSCYVCKKRFDTLHHFYDQMCPDCATLNFDKRLQTADLNGYKALVTGARVKIGYHTALKLLRAGALVIATSRFPQDAAIRYAKEQDYESWKQNLHVYGLDLRDLGGAEVFMDCIEKTFGWIDIVINNATQTIRRPTVYYQHLLANERRSPDETPAAIRDVLRSNISFQQSLTGPNHALALMPETEGTVSNASVATQSAELSQMPLTSEDREMSEEARAALFPAAQYDTNMQQVDLRSTNTWKLKIDQVESPELAEVFAINTLAPFILNKRAILLFDKSPMPYKFIVNVSAMEGKFYRYKTPHHPHTNMAKAAVNMMTRTCAEELTGRSIFMNSVDTGWINDENPREKAQEIA